MIGSGSRLTTWLLSCSRGTKSSTHRATSFTSTAEEVAGSAKMSSETVGATHSRHGK